MLPYRSCYPKDAVLDLGEQIELRVLACTHFHELVEQHTFSTEIPGAQHCVTEIC